MIAPSPEIAGRENDLPHESGPHDPRDGDPLHKLLNDFMAVRKYAIKYAAAEADLLRTIVRRWLLSALIGALLAVIGLTSLITAVVFALSGFARLLSDLSGIPWLGELVIGCGIVVATVLAGWAILSGRLDGSRRKTLAKYEHKRKIDRI